MGVAAKRHIGRVKEMPCANEEWKTVPHFGMHYEASTCGRIRVKDRLIQKKHSRTGAMTVFSYKGRLLSPFPIDKYGHMRVGIGQNGTYLGVAVHHLVLLAFVGECPPNHECCHENGIASDNHLANLRWDTKKGNAADRLRHGTYRAGESHPMNKYSTEIVSGIQDGSITRQEALKQLGVSPTHYHRIKNKK